MFYSYISAGNQNVKSPKFMYVLGAILLENIIEACEIHMLTRPAYGIQNIVKCLFHP